MLDLLLESSRRSRSGCSLARRCLLPFIYLVIPFFKLCDRSRISFFYCVLSLFDASFSSATVSVTLIETIPHAWVPLCRTDVKRINPTGRLCILTSWACVWVPNDPMMLLSPCPRHRRHHHQSYAQHRLILILSVSYQHRRRQGCVLHHPCHTLETLTVTLTRVTSMTINKINPPSPLSLSQSTSCRMANLLKSAPRHRRHRGSKIQTRRH